MKRTNFVKLYFEDVNAIEFLSDSMAGKVIKSVVKYARTGASPRTSDEVIQTLFTRMKNCIDKDREEYSSLCKKYSENAKKRYEKGNNKSEKASKEKDITANAQDDISFEHLWEVYNHPKSDRHRAELAWSIFSKDEKKAAIAYIPTYKIECSQERYFPYLAMYLGKKPWRCNGKEK